MEDVIVEYLGKPRGLECIGYLEEITSVHTYQAFSPIGLDLKLAKLPPKTP